MRPIRRARAVLLALLAATICACRERDKTFERPPVDAAPPARSAVSIPDRAPGRLAAEPKAETLDAARSALAVNGREIVEARCGPYRALTSASVEYLEVCRALAEGLDAAYAARFGISLPHPAAGAVLLFGSAEGFRAFAAAFGRLRPGYAGFTMASRGVVAIRADEIPADRFATVLGHELVHLAHRRVFGFNLEPWLSEGLADALGDTATTSGFAPLRGIEGVEPLAMRLRLAVAGGRAESIGAVVGKDRDTFDRKVVSHDYETSALLVRFLLLDGDLAPRFRDALRRRASSEKCRTECMLATLEITEAELDRRFQAWLLERTDPHP